MRIGVVTDSTADLPAKIVAECGIEVIPMHVQLNGRDYLDGIDLTASAFYELLKTFESRAFTSQPAPGAFIEVYRRMLEKYDEVVSIHVSSCFSGAVRTARLAVEALPGAAVSVVDSLTISMGLGALAMQAARDARQGLAGRAIVERIERSKKEIRLFATLDTLDYLQRGGRIGKVAGMLGSLLKIKPFLEVKNGAVEPLGKCRSRKDCLQKLLKKVQETVKPGERRLIAVMHTAAEAEALELQKALQKLYPSCEHYLGEAGPVLGCHTGPGALGVVLAPAG